MDGQIDLKTKTSRLERLINEQLERQKRIRENELPLTRKAVITNESRDDKSRYLARDEHNYYYSVEPLGKHIPGDVITVRADVLCGNTFRGVEID